jgi:hypothetical protein
MSKYRPDEENSGKKNDEKKELGSLSASKNIIKILSSGEIRIEYSSDSSDQLKALSSIADGKKGDEAPSRASMGHKMDVKFSGYDGDFNVTVDNNEHSMEELNGEDDSSNADQYAYVIVPIRLSNTKSMSTVSAQRKKTIGAKEIAKQKTKEMSLKAISPNLDGRYFCELMNISHNGNLICPIKNKKRSV